jgi:polyisoprenoid-binding protein YceI
MKLFVLTAVLAAAMVAPAAATDAVLDVPHTQAQFTVTHLSLSKVRGTLPLIAGTVTFNDAGMPSNASATFDVKGVITGDDNRDKSLRTQYFEADKYPTLTFVEKKIEGTPAALKVTGDMTLHGITKSVVLTGDVDGIQTIRGKREVGYTLHTVIDRRDFGIVFAGMLDNTLIAGNDVTIDIDAAAVEK